MVTQGTFLLPSVLFVRCKKIDQEISGLPYIHDLLILYREFKMAIRPFNLTNVLLAEASKHLQALGHRRFYDKGNLVTKGLPGTGYIFIVEEGQLDLYAIQVVTGKRLFIAAFRPGDIFGDFALHGLIDSEPENLVLETKSSAKVLYLPKEAFFQALDGNKEALVTLIGELVGKLSSLMTRASSLGLLSVKARLVNELIQVSREQGLESREEFRLRLRTSHEQLADVLGATRQSITRAFAELKKKGCITKDKESLIVLSKHCANCLDNECYRALF